MKEFATAYGPKGLRPTVECKEPSLARESMAQECDINFIIDRYQRTGVIEHRREYKGQYGAFDGIVDFHAAMNIVTEAQSMFETLPARIRADFGNDPGAFVAFATDPENNAKMAEYGLAERIEEPQATSEGAEATEASEASEGAA